MTKPRKDAARGTSDAEIRKLIADDLLDGIAHHLAILDKLQSAAEAAIERVSAQYSTQMEPYKALLDRDEKTLLAIMKQSKNLLFDGTDIVRLPHGSLIRELADKVKIPRDALAKCEELGFDEVVKIAKSLDRDAVEKWPDERLLLIGAERKPKEEFSYDLKKESAA